MNLYSQLIGVNERLACTKLGDIFHHYKGNLYRLLYLVEHTELGGKLVVYEDLNEPEKKWARPLEMFF